MIKSMTGFGRGEYNDGKRHYYVEIKTVNNRYGDITVKVPRRYGFAEEIIRTMAKEGIRRGKAEIYVSVEPLTEDDISIRLNKPVATQYINSLRELKTEFDLTGDVSMSLVATLPEVLKTIPTIEDEEEIIAAIKQATRLALISLDKMRSQEGENLAKDLTKRGHIIDQYLANIKEHSPEITKTYVQKMQSRIVELIGENIEIPEDRILLEAAIFADKASVTEEIVRLHSHLNQFRDILKSDKAVGKKLDFLVQEMNREANTIGSKANDLKMTENMLEIKSEIEKIREQIQNIE